MVAFGSALAALSITAAALFGAGLRDALLAIHEPELSGFPLPDEASAASGGQSVQGDSGDSRIHDVVDVLGKLLEHKPTCVCNVQSEKVGSCVDDPRVERTTVGLVLVVFCLFSFVGGVVVGCVCCPSQCIGHSQRGRSRLAAGPAPASHVDLRSLEAARRRAREISS